MASTWTLFNRLNKALGLAGKFFSRTVPGHCEQSLLHGSLEEAKANVVAIEGTVAAHALRLADLEGLNYGEQADEAALIALDAVEGVVKDGGLATIEGVQGIYSYDLGAGSGDIEGSFGWWNLDIDGRVTLQNVLGVFGAKGHTGYREVLGEKANEAALPASPALYDAWIQTDTGNVRECTAIAIVDPPTAAVWSTLVKNLDVYVVFDAAAAVLKIVSGGVWTDVASVFAAAVHTHVTLPTTGEKAALPFYLKPVDEFFDPTAALPAGKSVGYRCIASFAGNGWFGTNVYELMSTGPDVWGETVSDYGMAVLVKGVDLSGVFLAGEYVYHSSGSVAWHRLAKASEIVSFDVDDQRISKGADSSAVFVKTGDFLEDETIVIGGTTYTAKAIPVAPTDFLFGTSLAVSLAALKVVVEVTYPGSCYVTGDILVHRCAVGISRALSTTAAAAAWTIANMNDVGMDAMKFAGQLYFEVTAAMLAAPLSGEVPMMLGLVSAYTNAADIIVGDIRAFDGDPNAGGVGKNALGINVASLADVSIGGVDHVLVNLDLDVGGAPPVAGDFVIVDFYVEA